MEEKKAWNHHIEFLLASIGYAVGLGNIWRFPYLCYRNGGGAFLIPYTIALLLAGIPLFSMELALGQYSGLGVITVWKFAPIFKGIGWGMWFMTLIACIYYNVIIAWCVYMFAASLTTQLPWSTCDNSWNTAACTVTRIEMDGAENVSRVSASLEYFEKKMLNMSEGADQLGTVSWSMALCLLLAWMMVFLCLIKGIRSVGKVVYFTATFPYLMLTALLIRGVTLPGAYEGIMFYISPKWELLLTPKVWGDAAVQIFYSLGPGWGGLITMASFNKFKTNCIRDSLVVALINGCTSFYAGFTVFSTLGFMSYMTQTPIDKLATSGPGLVFVVYPEAIARMPLAPLWSCFFFFMLITLGLDSMFTMFETTVLGIVDEWPKQLRPWKTWITLFMSVCMYLMGLLFVSQAGIYWVNLVDSYIALVGLLVVCFMESVLVCYLYGFRRFSADIKLMTGRKPFLPILACWMVITPVLVIGILIFTALGYSPASYDTYRYPVWCEKLGWVLAMLPIICIPVFALIKTCQMAAHGGCSAQNLKRLFRPEDDWDVRAQPYKDNKGSTFEDNEGLDL